MKNCKVYLSVPIKNEKDTYIMEMEPRDRKTKQQIDEMIDNALLVGKIIKVVMYVEVKDE